MKEIHSIAKANASHTHAQSDITGLTSALSGKANSSHTHAQSDITNLTTTLAAKAPLASPTFTGTPKAPTPKDGTNSTQIATTAFVTSGLAKKQDYVIGAATTITSSDLTASRALVSNSNGKVAVSAVTATELGYLDGVTSNIQTQLNGKQAAISGTANAVMITDANGKPTVSSAITVTELNKLNGLTPTTTELNYMDGVTSAVQTQLNAKAGFPNYGSPTSILESDNSTYTPTANGYVLIIMTGAKDYFSGTIGGIPIILGNSESITTPQFVMIPVAKGTVINRYTGINAPDIYWLNAI